MTHNIIPPCYFQQTARKPMAAYCKSRTMRRVRRALRTMRMNVAQYAILLFKPLGTAAGVALLALLFAFIFIAFLVEPYSPTHPVAACYSSHNNSAYLC